MPSRERSAAQGSTRLAHELSNLLDGSLRNVSLALSELDRTAGGAVVEPPAERLRTASDSMRQMADLIKRWMRCGIPVDAAELYWQDAKLGEAALYARRSVEPIAVARSIELAIDLPPEVAGLPAGSIYPVLANGLRNAVEAVGQDGRVMVRGRREGDEVALEIRDDGPGVAADLPRDGSGLPRPGVTTKPSGHGIGLHLCHRIVTSLGGSIRLDNAPGGGAVLTIRFTAQDEMSSDCPETTPAPRP